MVSTDHTTGFLSHSILAQDEIFVPKRLTTVAPEMQEFVSKTGLAWLRKGLNVGPMQSGGHMKPSTKDQIKGKALEVKGKVKETVGQVTNNPDLTTEGQAEQLVGKFQKKVGQIEKVLEK